jgi:hypothetical protein
MNTFARSHVPANSNKAQADATDTHSVSDSTLRALALGDPQRALGEISIEDQAALVMILPDICHELLSRRVAMRSGIA